MTTKFKQFLDEAISPDHPLTRNQVRMMLLKYKMNPFKANALARSLKPENLTSPKAIAEFFRDAGFKLEQAMMLVKQLNALKEEVEQANK